MLTLLFPALRSLSACCLLLPAPPDPEPDPFLARGFVGVSITGSDTVVISDVVPGGPADRAGLRVDDVFQAIDGRPVFNNDDVIGLIGSVRPGGVVVVEVVRDGEVMKLRVTCAVRDEASLTKPPPAPSPYRQ